MWCVLSESSMRMCPLLFNILLTNLICLECKKKLVWTGKPDISREELIGNQCQMSDRGCPEDPALEFHRQNCNNCGLVSAPLESGPDLSEIGSGTDPIDNSTFGKV